MKYPGDHASHFVAYLLKKYWLYDCYGHCARLQT